MCVLLPSGETRNYINIRKERSRLWDRSKLWKVLSKYHNLPDHFHDLKTTLQAEFKLLKTATSKNIQSINEAIESQQASMTVLSGHMNTLYTKLAHLDKQVQIHCIYPHPQSDIIQLNPPITIQT